MFAERERESEWVLMLLLLFSQFHRLFSVFLISKYFAVCHERKFLCHTIHIKWYVLSPLRTLLLCSHRACCTTGSSFILLFSYFLSATLQKSHSIPFTMQSTIHTTTWLKQECSSSSFKQHTVPLMLTLKFAGAKKCIQFIALDRISNKREKMYTLYTQ